MKKDMFIYQKTGAIKLKSNKRLKGRKYCGKHNTDITIMGCRFCLLDLNDTIHKWFHED